MSSGHYGIFDVCWDSRKQTLVSNPHPPAVVHSPNGAIRSPSGIDIAKTDIHITDATKGTLVRPDDPNAGNDGYIVVAANSPVWDAYQSGEELTAWTLPQWDADDRPGGAPASSETEEDDALYLGITAGLLNPADWLPNPETEETRPEVQYEFEHEDFEHIGPGEGHAFVAHAEDFGKEHVDWNTLNPDSNEMNVPVGEYEHRGWIFTKPGTYIFQVHVKAHPNIGGPGSIFAEEYPKEGVTSEVREYKFHVSRLVHNHDPMFKVTRSVQENVDPGTTVGSPIMVADDNDKASELTYTLQGEGADNFTVIGDDTAGHSGGAQIAVAADADIDYETNDSYSLVLTVSDGKSAESNPDPSVDDRIGVWINVVNDPNDDFTVSLGVAGGPLEHYRTGHPITLVATVNNPPAPIDELEFDWEGFDTNNQLENINLTTGSSTWETCRDESGPWSYRVVAREVNALDYAIRLAESELITIDWQKSTDGATCPQ